MRKLSKSTTMADKVEKCRRERLFVHDSNHFPYSKKYYTTQEAHFFWRQFKYKTANT